MTSLSPYDAVVLAGGSSRRLPGIDKPAADVGGRALLDRVLAAVAEAGQSIVVGPRRPTYRPVTWTREDPAGGGPAAAIGAALPLVTAPWVAMLAADLPFLRAGDVRALRAAAAGHDGALLVDAAGQRQWLVGVWSAAFLRGHGWAAGGSVRAPFAVADAVEVRVPERRDAPWLDCDTTEDLQHARGLA